MKNFTNPSGRTLVEEIPQGLTFQKIRDVFKLPFEAPKGDVKILGYLKTKSSKFKEYSYALFIDHKGLKTLINIPNWYGEQLDDDFINSGLTAAEYFDDAYIKSIEAVPTKAGSDTYVITIFE